MDAVAKAIEALVEAGWSHIGAQKKQTCTVYCGGSPVTNGTMAIGGRQKLEKPGTQKRATVGKRSVCFFDYDGRDCTNFVTVKTSDVAAIQAAAV